MSSNPDFPSHSGIRAMWNGITDQMEKIIHHDFLALVARLALATVFFLSGRTKVVEGSLLTLSDNTFFLFKEEYHVPLLPSEFSAHMATYAEHLLPLLLALGLFTRLSALGLFGMTAVIQIFVYPSAWPTHLLWCVPIFYLVAHGGGRLSIDHLLKIR